MSVSKAETSNKGQDCAEDMQDVSKGWTVNKKLLPIKIFYFFFYGACGTVIPFIPVYLKSLKLTASEIGLITGVSVFLCIFSRPVIGLVADKLNVRKPALILCCLVFGSTFFLMWFIPERTLSLETVNSTGSDDFLWMCPSDLTANNRSCQIHFDNYSECNRTQETKMKLMGNQSSVSFHSLETAPETSLFCYYIIQTAHITHSNKSSNYTLNSLGEFMNSSRQSGSTLDAVTSYDCLQNCSKISISFITKIGSDVTIMWPERYSHEQQTNRVTLDIAFVVSFALLLVSRAFYATSTSLADAVTYTILDSDRLKWGEQRLWGTIGTAFAVITVTTLNDNLKGSNYEALFCLCLLWTCLACVVGTVKLKCDSVPKSSKFLQDICSVLKSAAVRFYFLKLLLFGIMCGSAQNFFLWFIDDIGGSQVNLGLVLLVYCLSSVVILRFTKRILNFMGQQKAMHLVLCCYVARYLAYSFIQSPWFALPIEILHGVTYSMFWAAASSTASLVAPHGTQATCQGLAGAIYWDLGRGLGTVVTGQLIDFTGARWTFRYYSAVCAAAVPICCLFDHKWSLNQTLKKDVDLPKDVIQDKTDEICPASCKLMDEQQGQTYDSKSLNFTQNPSLGNHPADGETKLETHCDEEVHSNHQFSAIVRKKDNSVKCDNQHSACSNKTCSGSEGSSQMDVTTPLLGNEEHWDLSDKVPHAGTSSVTPRIPADPQYSKQSEDSIHCDQVTLTNNGSGVFTEGETSANSVAHEHKQGKHCPENEGVSGNIEQHGSDREPQSTSEIEQFKPPASVSAMDSVPERRNGGKGIRITIFPS